MLSILHEKINNIAEIISIEQISENNFFIEYVNPNSITESQLTQINNIIATWNIELLKIEKIKLLDEKWNTHLKNGFLTQYGWKLGLENNDVTLLTGAFLLAKEAYSLGLGNEAIIIDAAGVSHSIPLNDLTLIMLAYGQYRTTLSSEYSETKNQIEQAQSIEELNNIII